MSRLIGEIELKGDKSISHRALIFAVLANGTSSIKNLSSSTDIKNTINCLIRCGANIEMINEYEVVINRSKLSNPINMLNCGNSGTSIRLLMGLMAGLNISAEFTGDSSLSNRPMNRVINKLVTMGARFTSTKFPIKLEAGVTDGDREININIASAQVKTAIILAALGVNGVTRITGKIQSRDHTERMLLSLSNAICVNQESITVNGNYRKINTFDLSVPGDISSASFIIGSAILREGSSIKIKNLSANPYRLGFVEVLKRMGADISINFKKKTSCINEPMCDIKVRHSKLIGTNITPSEIPLLIDEIPLISVLATQASGETVIRGASELRVKESDRISTICMNLKNLGADVTEMKSSMAINGRKNLYNTNIITNNDHRIALSFMTLESVVDGGLRIDNTDCISYSFPEFSSVISGLMK